MSPMRPYKEGMCTLDDNEYLTTLQSFKSKLCLDRNNHLIGFYYFKKKDSEDPRDPQLQVMFINRLSFLPGHMIEKNLPPMPLVFEFLEDRCEHGGEGVELTMPSGETGGRYIDTGNGWMCFGEHALFTLESDITLSSDQMGDLLSYFTITLGGKGTCVPKKERFEATLVPGASWYSPCEKDGKFAGFSYFNNEKTLIYSRLILSMAFTPKGRGTFSNDLVFTQLKNERGIPVACDKDATKVLKSPLGAKMGYIGKESEDGVLCSYSSGEGVAYPLNVDASLGKAKIPENDPSWRVQLGPFIPMDKSGCTGGDDSYSVTVESLEDMGFDKYGLCLVDGKWSGFIYRGKGMENVRRITKLTYLPGN